MRIRISVALCCSLLLSACVFQDRSQDYLKAGSIEPITVPPELRTLPMEPRYPIPEVRLREDAFLDVRADGFRVPRPDAKNIEQDDARIKIQRVGERRWILAEAPTAQVWPLAQSFLSREGVEVVRTQPATGLIETGWVQFSDDDAVKSQFRIRIEKSVRAEATEVHVDHRELPVAAAPSEQWSDDPTSPERAEWMLNALAQSLAEFIDNRSASLLGQAVGGEPKAELTMVDGEPTLRLRLDPVRSWATVAHAVDQNHFTRWGEDGANRVFYVQYFGFDKRRNWFTRLFLRGGQSVEEAPHSVSEVLSHLHQGPEVRELFGSMDGVEFGSALSNGAGYLVVLQRRGEDTLVRVRNHRGQLLDLPSGRRMLAEIYRQLI